jgi:hypothetical protein
MTSPPPTSAPRNEGVSQNAISLASEIIMLMKDVYYRPCLFHVIAEFQWY